MNVAAIELFYGDQEWAKPRRPGATDFARHRLGSLAKALGDRRYLDGERFTAGDLMMSTVLRILPGLVVEPRLTAYVERCTARPAFERALDAQMPTSGKTPDRSARGVASPPSRGCITSSFAARHLDKVCLADLLPAVSDLE